MSLCNVRLPVTGLKCMPETPDVFQNKSPEFMGSFIVVKVLK